MNLQDVDKIVYYNMDMFSGPDHDHECIFNDNQRNKDILNINNEKYDYFVNINRINIPTDNIPLFKWKTKEENGKEVADNTEFYIRTYGINEEGEQIIIKTFLKYVSLVKDNEDSKNYYNIYNIDHFLTILNKAISDNLKNFYYGDEPPFEGPFKGDEIEFAYDPEKKLFYINFNVDLMRDEGGFWLEMDFNYNLYSLIRSFNFIKYENKENAGIVEYRLDFETIIDGYNFIETDDKIIYKKYQMYSTIDNFIDTKSFKLYWNIPLDLSYRTIHSINNNGHHEYDFKDTKSLLYEFDNHLYDIEKFYQDFRFYNSDNEGVKNITTVGQNLIRNLSFSLYYTNKRNPKEELIYIPPNTCWSLELVFYVIKKKL